jgi:site-specific recombinase XerD
MSTASILKNQYGSVKPYTRHTAACIKHISDLTAQLKKSKGQERAAIRKELDAAAENPDGCSCPKWLYVRESGEPDVRYTLNTPSWTEALERATDKLKTLDPEIAASREAIAKQERERKTVYEAINLWLDRSRTKLGEESHTVLQYRSLFGWVKDGVKRGAMLRYAAEHHLDYIDEFTPQVCQQWLESKYFTKKKAVTASNDWGVVRGFFKYLVELDVLAKSPVAAIEKPSSGDTFAHSPYTDAQYQSLLDNIDGHIEDRLCDGEDVVFCVRVRTFLELLRWTGMDIVDAIQFRPTDQLEDIQIDGADVHVLRYRRTKTQHRKRAVESVIPIPETLAKALRTVPTLQDCVTGQPFRYRGNTLHSDSQKWSRRLHRLIKRAKIGDIPLQRSNGSPALDEHGYQLTTSPDVKMLRHTFVVGELEKGVPKETVAKELGHADTKMIDNHYGPWTKGRDLAHIRDVVTSRKAKAGSR